MRCSEAQRFFDAFLDSELLTETNLQVTDHIASCEACRLRLEGEERVRNRLAEVLRRTSEEENLVFASALAAAMNESHKPRRAAFRLPRRTIGLGFAGAAAASIILLMLVSDQGSDLARMAVENHRHMVEEAGTVPLQAKEIADSVASLSRDLDLRIASAPLLAGDVSVYLAQHCRLGDVSVAYFLVGEHGKAPVSFFVFPQTEIEKFAGEARFLASPGDLYEARVGEYRFSASSNSSGVICLVSGLDGSLAAEKTVSLLLSP